jgi:Gram-negative bacterial TonB protein C-terminal
MKKTSTLSIIVLCLGAALVGFSRAAAPQKADRELPVVAAASVPLYPPTARIAHIQGIVKIRVATDGKKMSSLDRESGPPILVQAAETNIRTWQFEGHKPTTFLVTFEYRLEEPAGCRIDNGTVVLRMPLDVQVIAKKVYSCDAASEVPIHNSE